MLTATEAARDLETPAGLETKGYAGTITHMTARRKEMLERMKESAAEVGPNTADEAGEANTGNLEAYLQERRMLRAMAERKVAS
jgi:hypothetical protein